MNPSQLSPYRTVIRANDSVTGVESNLMDLGYPVCSWLWDMEARYVWHRRAMVKAGGLWICKHPTNSIPGDDGDGWQLAVLDVVPRCRPARKPSTILD